MNYIDLVNKMKIWKVSKTELLILRARRPRYDFVVLGFAAGAGAEGAGDAGAGVTAGAGEESLSFPPEDFFE